MTTAPVQRVFAPTATFPPRPVLGVTAPGWPIIGLFVAAGAGVTSAALALAGPWGWVAGVLCGLLTLWCVWFFRDPSRTIPDGPGILVSPADGVICMVVPASLDGLNSGRPVTRISVFMNVFNVHVNRSPAQGVVESLTYHPGKFFNASLDKASVHNERLAMILQMADGRRVGCVQIAGLVARRIVCQVRTNTSMQRGDRYGLIRFGSRVDVYLPEGYEPAVVVGQRVVAGETILARDGEASAVGGGRQEPSDPRGAAPSAKDIRCS